MEEHYLEIDIYNEVSEEEKKETKKNKNNKIFNISIFSHYNCTEKNKWEYKKIQISESNCQSDKTSIDIRGIDEIYFLCNQREKEKSFSLFVNDINNYKKILDILICGYEIKQKEIVNGIYDTSFRQNSIIKISKKIDFLKKEREKTFVFIEEKEIPLNIYYQKKIKEKKRFKIGDKIRFCNKKGIKFECVYKNDVSEDTIYSYHTFIFPFQIIKESENDSSFFKKYETKQFLKDSILNKKYWKDVSLEDYNADKNILNKSDKEFTLDYYNKMQYFNDAPLKAIYGFGNPDVRVVTNYSFYPEIIKNKAKLTIQVGITTNNYPKEFELNLNAIRLKIFNTNVAIMIFEAENHNYPKIEDIKLINEYVRRVLSPNLTLPSNPCAFYWAISFENTKLEEKLLDVYDDEGKIKKAEVSVTKVLDPIKDLLTYPDSHMDKNLTSNITKYQNKKNCYLIKPILDDRMFVCSFIISDEVINSINKKYVEQDNLYITPENNKLYTNYKYEYEINEKSAKNLYSIIYIDQSDSTCQNMHDIQTLLDRDLYTRWIDWGTIYGITHHSCVGISTSTCPTHIIDSFLTLYVEMSILTIVQRASIILFQKYASELTDGIEREKKKLNQKDINQLLNLQERYIAFQNQLLFFEVSPEEQGVEFYECLTKSLYINEEKQALAEQLESLYEATNVNQDSNFNLYATIVAVIALILAFVTFVYDTISNITGIFCIPQNISIIIVIAIIISIIIVASIRIKKLYDR